MTTPPRYKNVTPEELEELIADGLVDGPVKSTKSTKRRLSIAPKSETFDVRKWRLPSKWRNDKRVGDTAMSKMLAGVDPARHERLADGRADG